MPNKKFNKKPQPVAEVSNPIFNATTLNDFTNLQLFATAKSNIASSSIDCNNPVAISPDYATSTSIPPTPIRASKPSNRWTSAEIRILIKEVGEHQQALQKVKDPRKKGRIWDNIVSNIQSSNVASPVLKERSKASIQQKWDTVFQKYSEYFL
ncbi:unnamed protein product [Rhizophagus irregularis]|uniref:Myb/SANT-like DNA-binding domain-containing protein n=1 Tax=Rhizophagus irregularis TaxID=588596 RepID=A0A915ZS23_9GLOM|nr:unnamed protein product [Rhizophagus irregularis]CAB5385908.1 unnamed protein product [Rhizophagus irregularis]